MLIEEWVKWEPIEWASPKYFLDTVVRNGTIFAMTLIDQTNLEKKIYIDFTKSPVYFQQKIATQLRVKALAVVKKEYGTDFIDEWSFFKIINSKQKEWMSAQAGVVYNFDKFQHFVLITTNYVVDIVAFKDPIVTMISNESEGQSL